MSNWAIDLGTTNSAIARWDDQSETPEMIHIEKICRQPDPSREIDIKYSIPSSLYLLDKKGIPSFLNSLPLFRKNFFFGREGLIGSEAIEKDCSRFSKPFISSFKPYLLQDSFRPLTHMKGRAYTAKEAASRFLRELLLEVKKKTGERPKKITFSVPVDCYEPYRAQLKQIAKSVGVKDFKTIDEPVAAALGYGLKIDTGGFVLVIDFGGGTLDMALIEILEHEAGRCKVIAKTGAPIGGNTVDAWIVEDFCTRAAYDLKKNSTDPNVTWWYRMMMEEACRVKESLFFKKTESFFLTPPEEMKNFEAMVFSKNAHLDKPVDYTQKELVSILKENGLYTIFNECLENLLIQAEERGIYKKHIEDVLMVGGSTLLPDVYTIVEKNFGRDKVRAWKPFDSVAYGACAYGAGKLTKSDFITHDYAFVTYNSITHKPEYNIIIPKGTFYPSIPDFWKRHLTPTCPLGEPEDIFKLVICEIGRKYFKDQSFVWDSKGNLHSFKEGDHKSPLVIPLNETNPTLGTLNPPHMPSDRSARLEVSFMVNEERWLCTKVYDIKAKKILLDGTPVIRLK